MPKEAEAISMKRIWFRIGLALLVFALVATSCSDGSDGDEVAAATATPTATPPTTPPISTTTPPVATRVPFDLFAP